MARKFTILFQGDSVTDCGRTCSEGAGFANNGNGPGYPGIIAANLLCHRPDVDWTVLNRGISGNRIVDLYARWKVDAIHLKPDLLSILIGVNDTWHKFGEHDNGVEVPRAERIYRELIEWTMRDLPGVRLLLMEPFAFDLGEMPREGIEEVYARAAFTKKLAKEYNTAFLPCQSILDDACKLAEPRHWLVDGVHPAPAGHQLLSERWIEAAKSILP